MTKATEYMVLLLDDAGCPITADLIEGLPSAKKAARYLISAAYARSIESTHDEQRTKKAEIRDARGECVWDIFL